MQLSCRTSQPGSADGAWQWESFRFESSNFYNEYNPDDSGKKIKMASVKEINRTEALGLSWARGGLTETLLCSCPQQFCLDEEALGILDTGMRTAVSCSHHAKHRKKIHFFTSDVLHIWENLLSALSILWSECKDWLPGVQQTSCGGVLCQAFHQGYETIGMENQMQNNVLLHFPHVLHILVWSTTQKGLTSSYHIPPAVQYGKNHLGKQQKKPLALRAFQHFRNTRFSLSSANQWSWTSVNGQN